MTRKRVLRFRVGQLEANWRQATDTSLRWEDEATRFKALLVGCFDVMAEKYGEEVPPKGYVPRQPAPDWVRQARDALGYSGCESATSDGPEQRNPR